MCFKDVLKGEDGLYDSEHCPAERSHRANSIDSLTLGELWEGKAGFFCRLQDIKTTETWTKYFHEFMQIHRRENMYTCSDGEEGMKTETNPRNPHSQRKKQNWDTKGKRPVSINATFFKGSLELSISIIAFHIYMWITWRGINRAYSALAWPSERKRRQTKQHSGRETIKSTEKHQDREGRVVFHAGLLSRPTLKLLHLFTV